MKLKDKDVMTYLDNVSAKKKSELNWDAVVKRIARFTILEIDKASSLESLEKRSKVKI